MTRFGWFFTTYFAILGAGTSVLIHPAPRLIWNATASTPVGLYRLQSARSLHVGDLIAIRPPADIATMLAHGGYLPLGVPLLKPVAALPGQLVCRIGAVVSVDGQPLGDALVRDHRGRPLPVWQGCRHVLPGQIFVMNAAVPTSLDGRYFGVLPVDAVLGHAQPLWLMPSPMSPPPNRNEADMAQIGTFTRTSDGFAGRLRTLALDVELTIVPATSSDAEHAPDYRVHLGDADAGPEIGAGWKRTGEKAGAYLSLVLDDPMLAQPIRANLFQSDRQGRAFHLVWSRPVKRDDRR